MSKLTRAAIQILSIESMITANAARVAKGMQSIENDPAYAMSWYADDFANRKICMNLEFMIARMREKQHTDEQIVAAIVEEALGEVLRPSSTMSSTSLSSNMVADAQRTFWAKLLDAVGVNRYSVVEALNLNPQN